jgi:hypothetical protein
MRTSGTDVLGANPFQDLMSPKRNNHRRGHYCWSCGKTRANEKFSGRGHAEHLCKDCARLGKEELAYRQTVRNLDRLLTWNSRIPRRHREQFRKYLNHKDERVRAYACQIEAADALAVAEWRLDRDLEEFLSELAVEEGMLPLDVDPSPTFDSYDDGEMPF